MTNQQVEYNRGQLKVQQEERDTCEGTAFKLEQCFLHCNGNRRHQDSV